jgi:hypothetical protein
MIDYAQILTEFYKGSEWSLNGDDYAGLTWLSDTAKPSKKTLDDLWPQVQAKKEGDKQAKADARAAILDRLGITADESDLLLG